MASLLALRRATTASSPLFNRLVNPVRHASAAPSVFRSFNTNTQMKEYDDDDRSVDFDRRSDRSLSRRRDAFPSFFSDVLDPLSPPRSVSQLLNMMDQFMDNPLAWKSRGLSPYTVREDDDVLCIKMDMPGLDKDNVKIRVEQNTLVIKGEAEAEEKEDDADQYARRRYSTRLEVPPNLYKLDAIKAEMKNGVLKGECLSVEQILKSAMRMLAQQF
nr:Heat shock 22 kDa protein, mitochondrial [Ipomoea batatas]